jgi:hypothetical protein
MRKRRVIPAPTKVEAGTIGTSPSPTAGATYYEVKAYSVQASFDLSTTRIPSSFAIVFAADPAHPDSGSYWSNRTPEAIAAVTALLDRAFAGKRKVYYDPTLDALGLDVIPTADLVGPKNVIPSK